MSGKTPRLDDGKRPHPEMIYAVVLSVNVFLSLVMLYTLDGHYREYLYLCALQPACNIGIAALAYLADVRNGHGHFW